MLEAAGCTLWYLPTYSPDYSPIELAFSKIKAELPVLRAFVGNATPSQARLVCVARSR